MRRTSLLIALLVALAGCTSDPEPEVQDEGPVGSEGGFSETDMLRGWVFDPALAPVVGAEISIPGEGATAITDQDGYYGFRGLPTERVIVVVAKADGFQPLSKSITLVLDAKHQMNFTLHRVPEKVPYMEKQAFAGFIGCSGVVRTEDQRNAFDCSSASPQDERAWEFTVNPDAKGIIIEVAWDPDTPAADHLSLTVETVGFGELDETLAEAEGNSVLRAQVTEDRAARFYSQGGIVRVFVDAGRNIEDEEAGAGAGLAFQQSFEVIASVFYVAPPPPGYTSA